MSLPNPRRIISTYDFTTGAPLIKDDVLTPTQNEAGVSQTIAYVSKTFVADPKEGLIGAEQKPDVAWMMSTGVSVSWIDVPAGSKLPLHFTSSMEYLSIAHGTVDLISGDNTRKTLNEGDLVVLVGSVHAWENVSDKPARILGVVLPIKPVEINGKTLDQAPFNAYKMF